MADEERFTVKISYQCTRNSDGKVTVSSDLTLGEMKLEDVKANQVALKDSIFS